MRKLLAATAAATILLVGGCDGYDRGTVKSASCDRHKCTLTVKTDKGTFKYFRVSGATAVKCAPGSRYPDCKNS